MQTLCPKKTSFNFVERLGLRILGIYALQAHSIYIFNSYIQLWVCSLLVIYRQCQTRILADVLAVLPDDASFMDGWHISSVTTRGSWPASSTVTVLFIPGWTPGAVGEPTVNALCCLKTWGFTILSTKLHSILKSNLCKMWFIHGFEQLWVNPLRAPENWP